MCVGSSHVGISGGENAVFVEFAFMLTDLCLPPDKVI